VSALDSVRFEPSFALPAGMPRTGWQTKSANCRSDTFIVDGDGTISLLHQSLNARFTSTDASGVFYLYTSGLNGADWFELYLSFHNGRVFKATPERSKDDGYRFEPTWYLDHAAAPEEHGGVDELITIIRAARAHGTKQLSGETTRIMVALALCDQDLLDGVPPAHAWGMLSPEHILALTTWWK